MSTPQKVYMQRFRERDRAKGCVRIEATVHPSVIEEARAMAQRKGWPVTVVVVKALVAYLLANRAEQAARKRQATVPRIVGPIG